MKGSELINALKNKFGVKNNAELAKYLGVSGMHPKNLEDQKQDLGTKQIANLVDKAMTKGRTEGTQQERDKILKNFITPITEYFPIEKVDSKHGKNYEISPPGEHKDKWETLRKELQKANSGIYIFYDSSGRAIYVGKTAGTKISLWARMKMSFNHDQQKSRKLYSIDHGTNAKRQEQKLGPKPVQLHGLAKYFSAYEVDPGMVHNIEALLIRAFADNLMNKKMETFKL